MVTFILILCVFFNYFVLWYSSFIRNQMTGWTAPHAFSWTAGLQYFDDGRILKSYRTEAPSSALSLTPKGVLLIGEREWSTSAIKVLATKEPSEGLTSMSFQVPNQFRFRHIVFLWVIDSSLWESSLYCDGHTVQVLWRHTVLHLSS